MDDLTAEFLALMEAAGWSQAEVARRLQISPGAVSQICSGKTVPRLATLNLLKLLVGDPGLLARIERRHSLSLDAPEKQLIKALRELSRGDRDRLFPLLHQMIRAVAGHSASPRKSSPAPNLKLPHAKS